MIYAGWFLFSKIDIDVTIQRQIISTTTLFMVLVVWQMDANRSGGLKFYKFSTYFNLCTSSKKKKKR